jgi:hypothetical protein
VSAPAKVEHGLERIGAEDGALQFAMLELLGKAGWQPAFVGPEFGRDPAGSSVLTARKYGRDLRVVAASRREAVNELLRQVARIERLPVLERRDLAGGEGEQLSLEDELQSWEEWWLSLGPDGPGS